ncbi:MAG: formate/nitrite transporter family protein [Muribaculaceae bacterium]|nr:formate/nitrite transporter family protein [Muribaculaceae bacterium]
MPLRSPSDTLTAAHDAGLAKATGRPLSKLVTGSILAGAYIALGGVLSIIIGYGFPGLSAANPGLQRLLSGLVFPIGLMLVVALGADLFTGNNALLIPPLMKRKLGAGAILRNWCIVWAGNFVGSLLLAYFLVYLTGLTAKAPYAEAVASIAAAKTSASAGVVFLKAIGANWCVCLAVWLALSGRRLGEKLLACEVPVMAFVALGFEHCVANMFFLPLAMMQGADISIAQMLMSNILPATVGNIVGGALFVGAAQTYLHSRD